MPAARNRRSQRWYRHQISRIGIEMISATKSPDSSYASSIDEARTLVRRCAEPRPAGDLVKVAIFRASRRLDIPFSRVRDIWYGDARRIEAHEMDQLRRVARQAELAQAAAAIEFLRSKILTSPSSASDEVFTSLQAALLDRHSEVVGG
jgi:hypothetical protein